MGSEGKGGRSGWGWGGDAGQLAIAVGVGAGGNGGVMWVPDVKGDKHPGALQSEQKQEVLSMSARGSRAGVMGRSGRLGRAMER